LQYGLLHIFGYDLPEDELRRFRQLGSRTPGHPEFGHTSGVECTTGPLGQGLAMAVGMALAERMSHARHPEITGHHTYAIVGDGCLMEGISHEAASFAGHLGLGRLVVLWDDNSITIDGAVDRACSDDQPARFAAYGWHTQVVEDGTDIDAIDAAIARAKADPRPSFIAVRTVIGHGAPGVEGTSKAHGSPLGDAVLAQAKLQAGWEYAPFAVPDEVRATCAGLAAAGAREHARWQAAYDAFEASDPERAEEVRRARRRGLPDGLAGALGSVVGEAPRATRQSSQACLVELTRLLPELVGGSADLSGSTGTAIGGAVVTRTDYLGPSIAFGIREFAMAAIMNGVSLHGGFRVYGSTFLVFADYLRPALRLAALMRQPVIHVLTHDSIAVGEDGPTHQPVEQLESLRVIPGLQVLRPADDAQTAEAWRLALERTDGPTALILSRQALPQLADAQDGPASIEIVTTGSEAALATAVSERLTGDGHQVRTVPVLDRSHYTPDPLATTVSIEAGSTAGWRGLVDVAIGIDEFGTCGPGDAVLAHHGFTADAVLARIHEYLDRP
jgi:transketolase